MDQSEMLKLRDEIERDEGRRRFPYLDTAGKWTAGVGRNLSDNGLSEDEIDYLLQNDIDHVLGDLDRVFPWWRAMTPNRQRVLANMCFNMGLPTLRTFRNTLRHMERGDYAAAAEGMRDSLWAKQVGPRADRLARRMELG